MPFPFGKIPTHPSFPIRPPAVEDEPVEPSPTTPQRNVDQYAYGKNRTTDEYEMFSDLAMSSREGDRRTVSTRAGRLYLNRSVAGDCKYEFRFWKGPELDMLAAAISKSKTVLHRKQIGSIPTQHPGLYIAVLADSNSVLICSLKPNGTRSAFTTITGVELANLARAVTSLQQQDTQ